MRTGMIKLIYCILGILLSIPISPEIDLDYNYEYEKNGLYTKFSDWVPYKLQ
ncbi:hypothetical protein LEP1GSC116_3908 [Leptospira interrogans serovar Icterohaemorrhagiae str. Verdun HP]|uniref:Uncharacterized protein n=1 Tax=Leptospira interrogans serovar Icterohaemorrhagiae str. Verdun HP TaxID=1049910 RepID=M6RED1_LEPIR|nr:hypothetical protein LEP1GSC116_3908 [Leptospira interrogans serovar Icterohaemorrhagiae str. Verdun HP]